jgi:adenine phosphoribosyltransferase
MENKLKSIIRNIPDFPKPGINFKDITPLFQDPVIVEEMTNALAEEWKDKGVNAVVGVESRGFLLGPGLAIKLGVPFVPVRKKGKLPAETIEYSYDLEYGSATIEMHKDAVTEGQNVLIHDDLLATGGTANAAAKLVELMGANASGFSFIVELKDLGGFDYLCKPNAPVHSLVRY